MEEEMKRRKEYDKRREQKRRRREQKIRRREGVSAYSLIEYVIDKIDL